MPNPLRRFTRLNFGPDPFVPTKIPVQIGKVYPNLVSIVDDDANEIIMGKISDLYIASASALGLYARYLKRIAAHSRNIISSVVNPFERIGYPE